MIRNRTNDLRNHFGTFPGPMKAHSRGVSMCPVPGLIPTSTVSVNLQHNLGLVEDLSE